MKLKSEVVSGLRGFSLLELLVVIAIISILVALALPSYLEWRRNIVYRTAARDIVSALREARSKSIASNRNYQVQFDSVHHQFGMRKGTSIRNTVWDGSMVVAWKPVGTEVTINSLSDISLGGHENDGIVFNPDGTVVSAATVTILDINASPRISIDVIASGKIKLR